MVQCGAKSKFMGCFNFESTVFGALAAKYLFAVSKLNIKCGPKCASTYTCLKKLYNYTYNILALGYYLVLCLC